MKRPFRVFVSSTQDDLLPERETVLLALEALDLHHASMEFFGARSSRSLETCLAEVRESDIVVVIVGYKYGSYAPTTDISYTQAEYEEAERLKKPILVYMKDDKALITPPNFEQDPQRLQSLLAFKEKLKQRWTVSFFSDPVRFAIQVTADLNRTIQEIEKAEGKQKTLLEKVEELAVSEAPPIEFYSCFISYSHADRAFAMRLHGALQWWGIRCWLDEHQALPGQKIYTEVDRGIRLWDKVLLCCSEDSLKSWWVENEIQIALDKEKHLLQEGGRDVWALIPLNLDGYLFGDEWKSGLRTEIRSRLTADFTGWETDNKKFEAAFKRLVRTLRADAGGREQPPRPRL